MQFVFMNPSHFPVVIDLDENPPKNPSLVSPDVTKEPGCTSLEGRLGDYCTLTLGSQAQDNLHNQYVVFLDSMHWSADDDELMDMSVVDVVNSFRRTSKQVHPGVRGSGHLRIRSSNGTHKHTDATLTALAHQDQDTLSNVDCSAGGDELMGMSAVVVVNCFEQIATEIHL